MGIMPSFNIGILGSLENDILCNMPNTGFLHGLSSRSLLNIPTKFYINFIDFAKYCSANRLVVIISMSYR